MTEDNGSHDISRRKILQTTGAAGAAGLVGTAGCLSNVTDDDGGSGGGGGGDGTLNVLHGWTGGDGATAAEALFSGFEEEHGDVDTDIEPIGGGGNENLDTVVANRLSSNDPPSAFAGWPGRNLEQYDGVLGDVEDVWDDIGDAHVEEAAELCQYDGNYAAVPIGSHRLNCLFYNVSVVEEAGVDPDSLSSLSDLVDALEQVASETDATPMAHAMKAPWTTLQLFAVVLLGQEGYDAYMNFVEGGDAEDAVSSALETTKTILENYINSDASSIGLTESNGKIMDGSAAFIHQGNWAAGAYKNEGMEYNEDWGFVPFPGTEGMYTFHIDSFIYPTDGSENPTPEVSKTFLRYVGGEQAQIDFNSRKGSIPTRTDVSKDEFGPYLSETMDQFANAEELPPTLAHGLAVSPTQMESLKEVITAEFTGPYNVEEATQGMLDVVQQ